VGGCRVGLGLGVAKFINGSYWGGGALIFCRTPRLFRWAGGGWKFFRAALKEWVGGAR
jgi:hypothetical protein